MVNASNEEIRKLNCLVKRRALAIENMNSWNGKFTDDEIKEHDYDIKELSESNEELKNYVFMLFIGNKLKLEP